MPPTPSDLSSLRCQQCGEHTLRVSRRRKCRGLLPSTQAPRYRCAGAACDWQGRLATPKAVADVVAALVADALAGGPALPLPAALAPCQAHWRRTALVGLTVVAAVGLPLAVAVVAGLETVAGQAVGLALAPGQSHDGLPLHPRLPPSGGQWVQVQAADAAAQPAVNPINPAGLTPLTLRHGCAWGQPGRNPYRGSTAQALTAARLPPEVVRQIVAQQQAGQKSGRLQINTAAIRAVDGPREFSSKGMAMSFGNSLCLNSRVNFAPGHVEMADLYEARDDQGKLHSVMVPDVCGNVTVLGSRARRGVVAGMAGALAQRSLALAAVANALAQDEAGAGPTAEGAAAPAGGVAGHVAGHAAGHAAGGAAAGDEPTTPAAQPGRHARAEGPASSPADVDESAVAPRGPMADPIAGLGQTSSSAEATAGTSPTNTLRGLSGVNWPSLLDGLVPRSTVILGLGSVAGGLAQGSETLSKLAGLLGDPEPHPGLTLRSATAENLAVPEPGTLACVLAALAVLGGLRWRRRR